MVTIDTRDLAKFQRALGHIRNGVPRAVSAAMNRAIHRGRTELGRAVRKAFVIKLKDLYGTLTVTKASPGSLSAQIASRHAGMLKLYDFPVRPKGGGQRVTLSASVRTGGGGSLGRAFVAGFQSGHVGVFARTGRSRLPIKELHAISAPIMASQPDVGEPAHQAIVEAYNQRSDHEIQRLLKSAGGK